MSETGLEHAKKLARMIKKWRPAGRRMRGEELISWQRLSLRSTLESHKLSAYFDDVAPLLEKTLEERTKAMHKSDAARYRRAYGRG